MTDANPTACLLVIGNEVLSGRTQDANIRFLGVVQRLPHAVQRPLHPWIARLRWVRAPIVRRIETEAAHIAPAQPVRFVRLPRARVVQHIKINAQVGRGRRRGAVAPLQQRRPQLLR
jgi:hypothetical protein